MLKKYLPYDKIYIACYVLLVIGLSTSKFLMSVSSIALASAWVLEGGYLEKWKRIKELHYAPLIISLGWFLLAIWFWNTSNLDYAFHDIVLKLPLLSFPIVIGSKPPLSRNLFKIILGFFVATTVTSTLISFGVYKEWVPTSKDLSEIRNISIFISHIRLSLLVCTSIVILGYYLVRSESKYKWFFPIIILWLLYFLILIQSGTGIVILGVVGLYITILLVIKVRSKLIKGGILLLGIATAILSGNYIANAYQDYFEVKDTANRDNLETTTALGEPYVHNLELTDLENGYYTFLYYAPNEMCQAWSERSNIPLDSLDQKGQEIRGTAIRYITSKGLRKDRDGVMQLTDKDIKKIESGTATCVETSGIKARLHEIFFEFDQMQRGRPANGHSVAQRLVFSYTGWKIFQDNWMFGVGTGDVPDAFESKYQELNSNLNLDNRLRAHNQLLTILITFGVFGFVIWCFSVFYPIIKLKNKSLLFIAFLLIAFVSFFSDDTFETQAGVTFYAFFFNFLLFSYSPKKTLINE